MYLMIGLMGVSVAGMIVLGIYLEIRPQSGGEGGRPWLRGAVGANLMVFVLALAALLIVGIQEVKLPPPWLRKGRSPLALDSL